MLDTWILMDQWMGVVVSYLRCYHRSASIVDVLNVIYIRQHQYYVGLVLQRYLVN